MTRIFKLLFLGLSFLSYSQDFKDNFPTEIKSEITEEHKMVVGTKFSAKIPSDYKFNKDSLRYQKKENLYVQFIESNTSNFQEIKSNFTREVIESKGETIDIIKDIKLNHFNAVFGEGPAKTPYDRTSILVFGDNEFVVVAVGVYPKNDNEGRNEILEILKSIVYVKDLKIAPLKLAKFEFDQSITGFKYAMTMINFYIYNEDGNPELNADFSNSIKIGAIPKPETPNEKSEEILKNIVENSDETLKSSKIITTKIGNYPASILEIEFETDNRKGGMIMAILDGNESRVVFIGNSIDGKSELLKKYKETLKTIKIK